MYFGGSRFIIKITVGEDPNQVDLIDVNKFYLQIFIYKDIVMSGLMYKNYFCNWKIEFFSF